MRKQDAAIAREAASARARAADDLDLQPLLAHVSHGRGAEKVLVLHDWMGDSANYDAMLPYLDPDFATYVFADLRGYGGSRHLSGDYTVEEVAGDALRLAERLGWARFHVVGHSMTGMVVQRMAADDWRTGARRIKSVVAITPVAANGYPADPPTRDFLRALIHKRELSEQGFAVLTGNRLAPQWSRMKTDRHLRTSREEAMRGYYRMWLETDFSADVKDAGVRTPILVIGCRQDLWGFQEEHLRRTFGEWYPRVAFSFIADAGHYPMQETPVYLASMLERFVRTHA